MPLYLGTTKIEDVNIGVYHRLADTVTPLPGGGDQHDILVDLDLSDDTVDAAHLAEGYTAHDRSGTPIVGTANLGAKVVATGTFTGPNTYYINVPVGTEVPSANFAFYMWTTEEMPYNNAKYKIIELSYILPYEFGHIGSDGAIVPSLSIDINNDGTITTKQLPPHLGYTTVYNADISSQGYSVLYDRPSWKKLNGVLTFYWNRNNAQYTFPAVTYNWKLIYFGSDYANEHIVMW